MRYDIHFIDSDPSVIEEFLDLPPTGVNFKTPTVSPYTVTAGSPRAAWKKFNSVFPGFFDSEGDSYVTITKEGGEVEVDRTWEAGHDSQGREFFREL